MNLFVGSRRQIHSAGEDAEAEVVVLDASIYPFIGSRYQLK
jgi:diphthamide synthase (EF-2-diphthine--ammonia ligase)